MKKLPFLHTQILELIYSEYKKNNKKISLEMLSCETGYPVDSKILSGAINALIQKGFLTNKSNIDSEKNQLIFELSPHSIELIEKFIQHNIEKDIFQPVVDLNQHFKKYESEINYDLNSQKDIKEYLNNRGIVHHWYDYLEDFPYKFTYDQIRKYCTKKKDIVLDPFVGSGTTIITAKLLGHNCYGVDANPLMKFVSTVKSTWDIDMVEFDKQAIMVNNKIMSSFKNIDSIKIKNKFLLTMPKRELNQWMSLIMQKQVAVSKDIINTINDEKIRNLFMFAMSKSAFDSSYVALCPGTTFYPYRIKPPFYEVFTRKLAQVRYDLNTLKKMDSYGKAQIKIGDSRNLSKIIPEKIKLSLTSPPYPNDLEYTRQTRLELYLLDFVKNMSDVQALKKNMIKGSTKLIYTESDSAKHSKKFNSVNVVSEKIAEALKDKNWGFDYPRMIKEYFGDMYLNMKSHLDILEDNGTYILVVGDQTYKEIVIPVGKILCEMADELGYSKTQLEFHRMRRSTSHDIPLPEENVILSK